MKTKAYIKFLLIIPALAVLFFVASLPNFSSKAHSDNYWHETEGEITINRTVHDFGTISESGDSVRATFTLTNNSKGPIVITTVQPSCGCTASEWTKSPIAPGKTGNVVATFGPKNRPGAFEKSINILTTGNPDRFTVWIKGTVERE